MSQVPKVEDLEEWLRQSQEALKIQKRRLQELHEADPSSLTEADERQIGAAMATTVTECNEHLLGLEQIEHPSPQEKEIMKGLNKLVVLGDEFQYAVILFRDQLREKRKGAVRASMPLVNDDMRKAARAAKSAANAPKAASTTSATVIATPVLPSPQARSLALDSSADPAGTLSADLTALAIEGGSRIPEDQPSLSQGVEPAVQSPGLNEAQYKESESEEDLLSEDPRDPLGLYAMLEVGPEAPMAEVRKAIRKRQVALHPDRSDDPDANTKFADFNKIMACFGDERRRAEYDATGKVEELKDLGRRMRVLTADAAWEGH